MARSQKQAMAVSLLLCLAILGGPLAGAAFAGPQFKFGTDNVGMLQLDYKGQFQMVMRSNGSEADDDGDTAEFNFRRNRLALMGKYGDLLEIYVQSEFQENQDITALGVSDSASGSDFTLLDAVIRFNFSNAFHLNVGKFKYSLSRENLEACEMPLTLDRSLFIRAPYTTTRDKGVAVWGNLLEDRFQYRFDIMNGRTATTENGPEPESDFRYTGRVHVTLLDPENTYGYKGTYLGERQVLTLGASYQYEPGVAYSDAVAMTGKSDYKGWTADLFFEYPLDAIGTITFSAAYEDIDLDETYKGSNPDPDAIGINGEKNGYYMKAGYMLPALPLQFFARYEKWEFASLNDIYDQEVNWYGLGANYYIWGQKLKVTAEYSRTDFDKEDANSKNFNTFVTQLQLIF